MEFFSRQKSLREIRDTFDSVNEFAKEHSTCRKVNVGCMIQDMNGNKVTTCNCSDDYNCKEHDDCYKYSETGIYESTEDTRQFCKAKHSEIGAIEMVDAIPNMDPENCTVWVTRYPCENCARQLADKGYKNVIYCGKVEISDTVKKIFDVRKVHYTWYPQIDYEYYQNV